MARYIDVEALTERLRLQFCKDCNSYIGVICGSCDIDDTIDFIEDAPTADVVEVKYGEWFEVDDGIDIGSGKHLECSICGKWKKDRIKSNYCPNCGAKMDGGAK